MSRASEMLASDAQWSYVKRLMREAFAKGYNNTPNLDVHHRPTYYTIEQASADIKRLLEAKQKGWGKG